MDGLAAWLLINRLCQIGIMRYGLPERHGWLTDSGIRLKSYIESKTTDELYNLTCRDQHYVHCYPDRCNCGNSVCQNPFWLEDISIKV